MPVLASLPTIVFLLCPESSWLQDEPAAALAIDRYSLANGVRVLAVHAPDAERHCTFTFLPLSLATEPAGKAQWAHLVEHMIIRSTDAEGMGSEELQFNGETGPDSLRLDTYATPDSFRESIERHAQWLRTRSVNVASLAREKNMIAMEEATVAPNLFTHKFAIAAWNQIVRHGRDHATVHADVANARAEDVQTFMEPAILVNESVLIATIGPTAPQDVRAALEETIGQLPRSEPDGANTAAELPALRAGEIEATWDLPVGHVLLWWPAPDDSTASRAVQLTAGNRLMMSPPVAGGGPVLSSALFHLPEGPVIIVNAALAEHQDPAATRDAIVAAMQETARWPQHALVSAAMLAQQLSAPPDFAALRAQTPPQLHWLAEGQWLLMMANYEYTWGMPLDEIASALAELDAAALQPALDALSKPPAGVLILRPREE